MIELGKKQCLNVVKIVDFGIYLGTAEEHILLPKKMVPPDTRISDTLEVFVYRDSSDRLIATTKEPLIQLGQMAKLKVSQLSKIGAFLDWGLEKDLFLPFKEQTAHIREGESYLVGLYIDKSNRLAATMRVYNMLSANHAYVKDSAVKGTVIEINPQYGIFVAVDDKYYGMIPRDEIYGNIAVGDEIYGRVSKVREDGKMMISIRQKAYIQMDEDARIIYQAIIEHDGMIPYTDKSDAEEIKKHFNMSKNAFKRGVGRLLKEGRINIEEDCIRIKENDR